MHVNEINRWYIMSPILDYIKICASIFLFIFMPVFSPAFGFIERQVVAFEKGPAILQYILTNL